MAPAGKRQQQSSETEALAWSPSHLNRLTLEDTAMCTLLPQGCAPGMIAGADIENTTIWQEENIIMTRGHQVSTIMNWINRVGTVQHIFTVEKEKSSIHHDDVMFCVIGGSWAKLSFVWTDYQNPSAGQWGLQHSQVISLVDTLNKESYACFSLKWNGRALLLVDNGHGQVPSAHSNRRLVLRAFPEWGFPIPN